MSGYVPAECTTVAILPSASADGHAYTGQNWDSQTLQRECMVVLKIHQENEPTVMLFTEAGFIGRRRYQLDRCVTASECSFCRL